MAAALAITNGRGRAASFERRANRDEVTKALVRKARVARSPMVSSITSRRAAVGSARTVLPTIR